MPAMRYKQKGLTKKKCRYMHLLHNKKCFLEVGTIT